MSTWKGRVMIKHRVAVIFYVAGLVLTVAGATRVTLVERVDVAPVWSGCPVGFGMVIHKNKQFLAFYGSNRVMTLAQRTLDSHEWQFTELPSKIGWDSHNYIAMAIDDHDFLHVSGNMHCVPLIYFRSTKPLDISTMEPLHRMTGLQEQQVTYPRFIRGPGNSFLFAYRSGRSGSGSDYWNQYSHEARSWSRLMGEALFDGEGKRNAYSCGPSVGPDGYYHLSWVWRDTPDCETCHNISYLRSTDLKHWVNAAGKPVALPVRLGADVVIDPVPNNGGLINPCQAIGFDAQGRVVVSYTKYDAEGNTQLMNARWLDNRWQIVQSSEWNYRWAFAGRGSIIGEIGVGRVELQGDMLVQSYRHKVLGSGRWQLDTETLKPIGKAKARYQLPSVIGRSEHPMPAMAVRHASDWAANPATLLSSDGFYYRACWESLPANRDRPQPGGEPQPSMLRVYKMKVHTDN